jgi:5'-3' exonuclease
MILLDYNQVCIANLMAQIGNHTNVGIDENLLRHMVLNTIRSLKTKFCADYGELIICCDDKKVWRKEVFKYYKANRKKAREESELDWGAIFTSLNKIKAELKEYFPYKVIQIEGAEADDVIGALTIKHGQMLNTGEKILILSGDKDFGQLQVFGNVTQFDPVRKKLIKHEDPVKFTRELILKGDRGDGIPNILSPDNSFVDSIKQKPMRVQKYIDITNPRQEFKDELLRNWIRNEQLIDLTFIPDEIQAKVLDEYDIQQGKGKDKLFNYFVTHKLSSLMESIQEF